MLAAAHGGRTETRLRRNSQKRVEMGQITPKMQKFLAEAKDCEPFLVVDVDVVEHNYRELRRLLPLASVVTPPYEDLASGGRRRNHK